MCYAKKIIRDSRKPHDMYEELLESEGVDALKAPSIFEVLDTVIILGVTRMNI